MKKIVAVSLIGLLSWTLFGIGSFIGYQYTKTIQKSLNRASYYKTLLRNN